MNAYRPGQARGQQDGCGAKQVTTTKKQLQTTTNHKNFEVSGTLGLGFRPFFVPLGDLLVPFGASRRLRGHLLSLCGPLGRSPRGKSAKAYFSGGIHGLFAGMFGRVF